MATKKAVKETETKTNYQVSPEELFEAGAHFGHQIKRWNPKMSKFLWGKRMGVHIFDLEKTAEKINEACKALEELAAEGKRIALVGTKRQAKESVRRVAAELKLAVVTDRWLGGTVTNWKQTKSRIERLNDLKKRRDTGALKKYTKKEQILFDREIVKLEKFFGGLSVLDNPPEVLVIVDTHRERSALREAKNRNMKVVGIVDSNGNPDNIDYVIPMNDDATKALDLVVSAFGRAIAAGRTRNTK